MTEETKMEALRLLVENQAEIAVKYGLELEYRGISDYFYVVRYQEKDRISLQFPLTEESVNQLLDGLKTDEKFFERKLMEKLMADLGYEQPGTSEEEMEAHFKEKYGINSDYDYSRTNEAGWIEHMVYQLGGWLQRYDISNKATFGYSSSFTMDAKIANGKGTGQPLWHEEYDLTDLTVLEDIARTLKELQFLRRFQAEDEYARKILECDDILYQEPTLKEPGCMKLCFKKATSVIGSALNMPTEVVKPLCKGDLQDSVMIYNLDAKMLEAYKALIGREKARKLLNKAADLLEKKYKQQVQIWENRFVVISQHESIIRHQEYDLTMKELKEYFRKVTGKSIESWYKL